MKKFIKNNIKVFVTIVISGIVFSGISVYAAGQYFARDISFTPINENFKKENGEPIDNVEDAINYLYEMKENFEIIYTNNDNKSVRDSSIKLNSEINTILVECSMSNKSYFVKIEKGNTTICGYHYLSNNVWFENNRYLDYNGNGNLYIGWPRNINLSTGNIQIPSDSTLFIKKIYKVN